MATAIALLTRDDEDEQDEPDPEAQWKTILGVTEEGMADGDSQEVQEG